MGGLMEFFNDYELLYFARQENEFAINTLFRKYEKMLWSIIHQHTKHYTNARIDQNDFMQHANLSFYQSIFQYREDRKASFSTFTYTCIDRKVKTLLRDMFRGNSLFYLDCISMDQEIQSTENITLIDTIENPYPEYCPKWNFQLKEQEAVMNSFLDQVKSNEREIFMKWKDGYSYSEIASTLQLDTKYVDNTIQKIRKIKNKYMNT